MLACGVSGTRRGSPPRSRPLTKTSTRCLLRNPAIRRGPNAWPQMRKNPPRVARPADADAGGDDQHLPAHEQLDVDPDTAAVLRGATEATDGAAALHGRRSGR